MIVAAALLYLVCVLTLRWQCTAGAGRICTLLCALLLATAIGSGAPLLDAALAFAAILFAGEWIGILRKSFDAERHAAEIDRLTEALTPRGFCRVLETELQAARREARPVGLVFLDLDHFKTVNDRFGHEAGDLVLKELADRLRRNLLSEDQVARLGCDEFVVFLRHIEGEDVVGRFRRLLKQNRGGTALRSHG